MSLFFTDNTAAIMISLILLVIVLKVLLQKKSFFQKNPNYVVPILFIVVISALSFTKILKIISFSVPLFAMTFIGLVGLLSFFYIVGCKENTWNIFIKGPGMRLIVTIAIIVIFFIAAGRLMGDKLLEEKSVSLLDPITEQESKDVDFTWFFKHQFLSFTLVFLVMGFSFLFVCKAL